MKNIKSIIAVLMLFVCIGASAQAQNYKAQTVSPTGILTNESNVKIGTIEPNGDLRDSKGMLIGRFIKNTSDPSSFDFSDKTGRKIATVLNDGTVKDPSGKTLYTVSAPDENRYCKVYDAEGKEVGFVYEDQKQKGPMLIHFLKKK
jgi:uncharacterized protein YdeI (BOF family)